MCIRDSPKLVIAVVLETTSIVYINRKHNAALGVTEDSLEVLAYNGTAWVPVFPCTGCAVDNGNNVVVFTSTQATEFALAGTSAVTPPPEKHTVYVPLVMR